MHAKILQKYPIIETSPICFHPIHAENGSYMIHQLISGSSLNIVSSWGSYFDIDVSICQNILIFISWPTCFKSPKCSGNWSWWTQWLWPLWRLAGPSFSQDFRGSFSAFAAFTLLFNVVICWLEILRWKIWLLQETVKKPVEIFFNSAPVFRVREILILIRIRILLFRQWVTFKTRSFFAYYFWRHI